jgi:hypothetical protein
MRLFFHFMSKRIVEQELLEHLNSSPVLVGFLFLSVNFSIYV